MSGKLLFTEEEWDASRPGKVLWTARANTPIQQELIVDIHLNHRARFAPVGIRVPQLNVSAIWLLVATKPDQSLWSIWRLHRGKSLPETFEYPTA
jgi:hypothetical protein